MFAPKVSFARLSSSHSPEVDGLYRGEAVSGVVVGFCVVNREATRATLPRLYAYPAGLRPAPSRPFPPNRCPSDRFIGCPYLLRDVTQTNAGIPQ
jgi:hypothetical protein